VDGSIGAEDEGHVPDTFAMWHGLGVQCDMDGRRVIMVL
jgi:hypothetical protein